jgi:hypothetical protein
MLAIGGGASEAVGSEENRRCRTTHSSFGFSLCTSFVLPRFLFCTYSKDKQSVSSPLKKKSKKDKVSIAGIAKSSRFRSDSEPAAAAAGGAAPSKNAGGTGKTTLKLKKGSGSTYVCKSLAGSPVF